MAKPATPTSTSELREAAKALLKALSDERADHGGLMTDVFTGYKLLSGKMKVTDLKNPSKLHHAIIGALAFAFVVASLGATFTGLPFLSSPLGLAVAAVVGGLVGKSVVI